MAAQPHHPADPDLGRVTRAEPAPSAECLTTTSAQAAPASGSGASDGSGGGRKPTSGTAAVPWRDDSRESSGHRGDAEQHVS